MPLLGYGLQKWVLFIPSLRLGLGIDKVLEMTEWKKYHTCLALRKKELSLVCETVEFGIYF